MAALLLAVALFTTLLPGGHTLTGSVSFSSSSVTCSPTGFEPTFTYDPSSQTQDVGITIDIGSDADTKCEATIAIAQITSSVSVTKSDFDASYSSASIPFLNDADGGNCGGTLTEFDDSDDSNIKKIKYEVTAEAIVTRRFRGKVYRQQKFPLKIICVLVRETDAVTSDKSFKVETALVDATSEQTASTTFDFGATLKLYTDSDYDTLVTAPYSVNNDETVHMMVESTAGTDTFKYVVEQCYSTVGDNSGNDVTAANKDIFFDAQCHLDETIDFRTDSGNFQLEIMAFTYPSPNHDVEYYFHCSLLVCLATNNDAGCTQKLKSACTAPGNNRRRRSVKTPEIFHETISSSQPVLLKASQFFAPTCGEGHVYDREIKLCSEKNILEINGIRLSGDKYVPDFANTSSEAFKDMAMTKEYQLWVLVKAAHQNRIIRGVKIIRAYPGSVVLDVQVKYTDSITPKEAFETFQNVLRVPASTSRVQNILKIDHERTIEYIPVVVGGSNDDGPIDSEKLILIIVVAILFVVILIAGVTLFKVRKIRQIPSGLPTTSVGVVNKGIDA